MLNYSVMKQFFILLTALIVGMMTMPCYAQDEDPGEVFRAVEQMPAFPGGDAALMKYINEHLQYPPLAMENNIEGRVIVQFVVTKAGKIGDVKVVRSVDSALDAEAVRVVKTFPDFIPGRSNGKPVNTWYTLPITFRLAHNQVSTITPSTQDNDSDEVFRAVEQMPVFPGGDAALMKYIDSHLQYPPTAMENGIQGRVIVQFVVTKTGKIGDVKVVRGVDSALDAEAVRVVKTFPDFIPGRSNGKPVNTWYTLPITFRLAHNQVSTITPSTQDNDSDEVFRAVEQMPVFPGGDAALMKYIDSHLQYPPTAMENGIQGRVIVQFVVTKTGKIGDVKVVRGVDSALDAEAVRLTKSFPDFIPGKKNGRPVNVWYTLPITFKLTE